MAKGRIMDPKGLASSRILKNHTLWTLLLSSLVVSSLLFLLVFDPISIRQIPGSPLGAATKTERSHVFDVVGMVNDSEENLSHVARRLLSDPLVKERYLSLPKGFRKHPSYFSSSYVKRGPPITAKESADLASKWGSWTLVDVKRDQRPKDDFYQQYPHRDVPREAFPPTAWQVDQEYLAMWLPESIELVERAMEGILAEYGHSKFDEPQKMFSARSDMFSIDFIDIKAGQTPKDSDKMDNAGWITPSSWQGLIRRLLHAIMTEDTFTLAMGGHSSAAGHGNHFQQSYTMQYHRVMEPVFARLGVKGMSRNFGMGGLGTMHNALGAGDIYGTDVDILVWDSRMTEHEEAEVGVFAVQSILGSDRAPIVWAESNVKDVFSKLHKATGADVGVVGTFQKVGQRGLTKANTYEELDAQPWAARYLLCASVLRSECRDLGYNGTCWYDRSSFKWEDVDLSISDPPCHQKDHPGGRTSWHPGNKAHQLTGRALAFTVLRALHDGLTMWMQANNYALHDDQWHVTDYYDSIHGEVGSSDLALKWCELKKLPSVFCTTHVQARTENTPRNRPWETSIRSVIKASGSFPDLLPNEYDPPDVPIPELDPPKGEVNVVHILENGVDFAPNLARIRSAAEDMSSKRLQPANPMNPVIKPGKGWSSPDMAASDNCDGTYDSFCGRDKVNECQLYGHNDRRGGMTFDSLSGWIVFQLDKLKHGMIAIKLHDWLMDNAATEGWACENNDAECKGRNLEDARENNNYRRLKAPEYCEDFKFQFAINGKITTLSKEEWIARENKVQRVVQLWVLLDDPSFTKGNEMNVELALRAIGCGRTKFFELTHIYWA